MKAQISKEKILPVLTQVQSILEKRSSLPIFSSVLITGDDKGIQIQASDSELNFLAKIEGKVKTPGQVVIDGKKFCEIVKALSSGDFNLSLEGKSHRLKISQNKSQMRLAGLDPVDFPKFPADW